MTKEERQNAEIDKFNIAGFGRLSWAAMKKGDVVWLAGLTTKEAPGGGVIQIGKAYGPYQVFEPERRTLRNVKGNIFMHYAEDLIAPTMWD